MTIKQFHQLDETEQFEAVWYHGALLGDHREDPFRYILYQISNFYVELRYHQEHNILTGLRAFDDPEELELYLEQIKLHQEVGYPTATLKELRDSALKLLPPDTVNQILAKKKEDLLVLNYSVGLNLRNHMDLWHTVVRDGQGNIVHTDDVTMKIIEEIWCLSNQ